MLASGLGRTLRLAQAAGRGNGPKMTVWMRAMPAVAAAGFLLGLAGCTKTSDGSIEFHRQKLTGGGLLGSNPEQSVSIVPTAFPPPPMAPEQPEPSVTVRRKPPARAVRRSPAPKPAAAQIEAKPAPALNCRQATQAGERVKFVCR